MSTPREILAELVAIDSTSHRSNAPMIDLIASRLKRLGFAMRRLPYVDAAGVEKINLVAVSDERSSAPLALVGHTDCVPFDAAWSEALRLTERDGNLYGRGACDTKGFVACALAAAERVAGTLARPLALVFTADEEIGCLGAHKLLDARALSPRHAIVGEPTSLTPVRAHKGYALAQVEVVGREGHSAYPESGASAIAQAARMIARLEDVARALARAQHPGFEPPFTTLNVGRIEGGKAANIIPGECRFTIEWRPIPGQSPERVLRELEAAASALEQAHGVAIRVTPTRSDPGVDTPGDAELVQFLEKASGRSAVTVSYATEAPQLTALGAQAVVFGPGDIRNAHRTGEFVPTAELDRCADILTDAVQHFCR